MIDTNDISEEKINMKQTMEGMKLYCFLLEHPTLVAHVPSLPLTFCSCRMALWKDFRKPFNLSDFARCHLLSGSFFFLVSLI